jgi:hypothetical protein
MTTPYKVHHRQWQRFLQTYDRFERSCAGKSDDQSIRFQRGPKEIDDEVRLMATDEECRP